MKKKSKYKLFKPYGNLMNQLDGLTKDTAKEWYCEYLSYHKGIDNGVDYLIGYFVSDRAKQLRKWLGIGRYRYVLPPR